MPSVYAPATPILTLGIPPANIVDAPSIFAYVKSKFAIALPVLPSNLVS